MTLTQLRERKIAQWLLAYLAGAWLVLQVVNVIADSFGWSDFWVRSLIVVLGVGIVVIGVLAWYHGERGAQHVSGVEGAILACLLVLAGFGVAIFGGRSEATDAGDPESLATSTVDAFADAASIAVLPFENLSSDPEQTYFSDGLTEELLNALAHIPGLRVSARTSSFAFKDSDATADSIGRALNVAHLVEGSVRKAGDQIRVNAQLIDAATGTTMWSASFDRPLMDVFAIQDEISRSIADELRVRVGSSPLAERGTSDSEAYALLLRAKRAYAEAGGSAETTSEAERLFSAALQRDPSYAEALAGLASVYSVQTYAGLLPRDSGYALATRTAERALDLDPNTALAHSALARIADFYERDYPKAEEHYRRALAINPSDSRTRSLYAAMLMRTGKPQDALREGQLAVDLDPISVGALNNFGEVNRYARQYDDAVRQYENALALNPDGPIPAGNLTLALALKGDQQAALDAARNAVAMDPDDNFNRAAQGYAFARAGRREDAERSLASLPADEVFLRAMIASAIGDLDSAFRLLDRAVDANDDFVGDVGNDPVFDPLRADPRYTALIARIKRGPA